MSNNNDNESLAILESRFRNAFDAQIAEAGNNFSNSHGWLNVSDRSDFPFLAFRDARARHFAGRSWSSEDNIRYSWEIVEIGGSLLVQELIGGSRRYEPVTADDLRLALSHLALLEPGIE